MVNQTNPVNSNPQSFPVITTQTQQSNANTSDSAFWENCSKFMQTVSDKQTADQGYSKSLFQMVGAVFNKAIEVEAKVDILGTKLNDLTARLENLEKEDNLTKLIDCLEKVDKLTKRIEDLEKENKKRKSDWENPNNPKKVNVAQNNELSSPKVLTPFSNPVDLTTPTPWEVTNTLSENLPILQPVNLAENLPRLLHIEKYYKEKKHEELVQFAWDNPSEDPIELCYVANSYCAMKQFPNAHNCLTRIAPNPDSYKQIILYNNRSLQQWIQLTFATSLYGMKSYQEAIKYFDALSEDPNFEFGSDIRYYWADSCFRLKQFDKAIEILNKFKHTDVHLPENTLLLSFSYYLLGKHDLSRDTLLDGIPYIKPSIMLLEAISNLITLNAHEEALKNLNRFFTDANKYSYVITAQNIGKGTKLLNEINYSIRQTDEGKYLTSNIISKIKMLKSQQFLT